MSLRVRLIVAFLLMSVVPLTAVTLLSYTSSVRAFERAARQEAIDTATDVGQRMELITADLGRRMDRMFLRLPDGQGVDVEQIRANVAPLLGDSAALLERVEFMPAEAPTAGVVAGPQVAPDSAADSRVPSAPPAPPAARLPPPAPPGRPAPPPVVLHMRELVEEATRAAVAGATAGLGREFGQQLEADIRQGLDEAGLKAMAARAGREATSRAAESRVPHDVDGRNVAVAVHRDGRVLGHAHATLNMDRTMHTVLALARRDRGEIPFAVDRRGALYTPDEQHRPRLESLGVTSAAPAEGPHRVGDWIVAAQTTPAGITFGIARPIGESLREIRRASVRNLGLGMLVVALALAGIVPISAGMTRHLTALTGGVRQLAGGDFSTRVPVRSSDEFGELAQAFNQMAADLERHEARAVEQESLRRELELSRLIQTEMLPRGPLVSSLAEIAGISLPAREVGGDFFNYFLLPDNRLALLVGDVSGKGVSAALLMANVQATLRARIPYEPDLARLADALDRELYLNTPGAVYLTLFLGLLEPDGRTLRYINAGHNPQFLLRAGGGLEPLTSTGLPIALYAGHGYREAQVSVGPGDLLFFYTDGLVETEDERGEMFGAERLQELLGAERGGNVNTILQHVIQAAATHRGAAEPFDDATVMALRIAQQGLASAPHRGSNSAIPNR